MPSSPKFERVLSQCLQKILSVTFRRILESQISPYRNASLSKFSLVMHIIVKCIFGFACSDTLLSELGARHENVCRQKVRFIRLTVTTVTVRRIPPKIDILVQSSILDTTSILQFLLSSFDTRLSLMGSEKSHNSETSPGTKLWKFTEHIFP